MEIHLSPAQEAFLQQHVSQGRFATTDAAVQEAVSLLQLREAGTGADIVAAMQASPHKEINIEPTRYSMPVRSVEL